MADEFTSPREIAELNIRHYEQLLEGQLDDQTRTMVKRLLAEEKAKLADLTRSDQAPPTSRTGEPTDTGDDP